jgi:O-antigen/teichoic acid export membrane protein
LNIKAVNFIKNFSYTITSNLISLFVSILVVLIVPKLIGIEEYGYWQLYLFYSSYVGFLHFGWNDGIYLRYGGKKYEALDKKLFFSQFYMLAIFQLIIAVIIFLTSNIFVINIKKVFVFKMTAICMIIVNVRYMLIYILQITNKIKEYAKITIMDRILYCCVIITFLFVGVREFQLMILADLIGKFISLVYSMYCCRDIVFRKISTFYFSFRETIQNINVGIKLMFANIASNLIIGVVRFGIERTWDVSTFGKVSLTLSISNFMMLFINAVGIIMFPILKRTDEKRLPSIYVIMRDFLMLILLGALIVYYPFKVVLSIWLPNYSDSLMYMALVFPMCVFEGKMSLLINTYLKTLRKEKLMLKINLISLALSVVITFITTVLLKNLNLAIASIVVILAFRCVLSEIFLSKILVISLYKDVVLELIMTLIFILTGWFINSLFAVLIYVLAYIMYLVVKRKDITNTIQNLKILIKA